MSSEERLPTQAISQLFRSLSISDRYQNDNISVLEIDYKTNEPVDIMIMGEFDNWKPQPMNMKFDDGKLCYFYEAFVPVGYKYRFQFIINGEIKTDPNQPESTSTLIGRVTNYKILEDHAKLS